MIPTPILLRVFIIYIKKKKDNDFDKILNFIFSENYIESNGNIFTDLNKIILDTCNEIYQNLKGDNDLIDKIKQDLFINNVYELVEYAELPLDKRVINDFIVNMVINQQIYDFILISTDYNSDKQKFQ